MAKSTLIMERVDRRQLSLVIADRLLETLERDDLAPGAKLPSERELMRMLHVGRSTVREALNGLALAGVIEIRHGQGCFVASLARPAPHALELALRRGVTDRLMEARIIVEVEMAGLAADRATDDELAEMEKVLTAYERAVRTGASTVRHSSRLHERLLAASHNEVLVGFVRTYMPKVLERGDELEQTGPENIMDEYLEHRSLYEAVRDRDAELARTRMRAHLEATAAEFVKAEQA
jgi:GntR family transcriptional regulator, transcriptional repressor for pyruvate dehydrogenase complex